MDFLSSFLVILHLPQKVETPHMVAGGFPLFAVETPYGRFPAGKFPLDKLAAPYCINFSYFLAKHLLTVIFECTMKYAIKIYPSAFACQST